MALQVLGINKGQASPSSFLRLFMVLFCCYFAGTSHSDVVETPCRPKLEEKDFAGYSRDAKWQIQQHLRAIYGEDPDYRSQDGAGMELRDGWIGSVTLYWLNKFCTDYQEKVSLKDVDARLVDELVKSLAYFGELARDWRDGFGVAYEFTQEFTRALTLLRMEKAFSGLKDELYPTFEALWTDVQINLAGIVSDPSRYRNLVKEYVIQGVWLTQKSLDALKQGEVDIPNFKKLKDLKGNRFVNRVKLTDEVEKKGIVSRESPKFFVIENAILSAAEPVYSLTSESIENIRDKLDDHDGILELASASASVLQPLIGVEYPNKALFLAALRMLLNNQHKSNKLEIIGRLARQDHGSYQRKAIDWNGNSCGCVLDNLSGTVYGFYPFWLAAGAEQQPDFSVLSRIGYQAVTFDGQGEVSDVRHWQSAGAEFVDEARKHRTKVDLVVYKPWAEFVKDVGPNKPLLEKITTRLTELVAEKLTSSFLNVIKPYVSFGSKPTPSLGDGITLYLDGYPTDESSSRLFTYFIKRLRNKLKAIDPQLNLNVIISLWAIETKPYLRDAVADLVPAVEQFENGYQDKNDVDLFLVFLREPSSHSKKTLRRAAENLFAGNDPATSDKRAIQRRNFLRKIVPIMIYNGQNPKQLTADLTYFEDNFGGAGFWPMPIADTGGSGTDLAQKINFALKTTFVTHQPGERNSDIALVHFFQEKYAQVLSLVSHWVCENRWTVRIIADVLLFGLIVPWYLYRGKCQPSWAKWAIGLTILTAIAWFMLLFFDPSFEEISKGNVPLIIVISLAICYAIFRYRKNQAPLP